MTLTAIESVPGDRTTKRLAAVPVDAITAEARQVVFGRTVAALLTGLFYVLGYGAARTLGVVWYALVWCAVAVKVGWVDARRGRTEPS